MLDVFVIDGLNTVVVVAFLSQFAPLFPLCRHTFHTSRLLTLQKRHRTEHDERTAAATRWWTECEYRWMDLFAACCFARYECYDSGATRAVIRFSVELE